MEALGIFIKFLQEIFPTLLAYKVGSDSKKIKKLKDENEKLKEYQKIDNDDEPSANDIYLASVWK